jgi:hypothetical protein
MKRFLVYLFLSLVFSSCDEVNLNDIASNQFVVEGFLYAGEPINDIRVKSSFPLADTEDTSVPINNAEVRLLKNGHTYVLKASGENGYYHYPNEDLKVNTGDQFQLEVSYNGIKATAKTIVPSPTTGLKLSLDSLKVPQLPFSEGREAITAAIRKFMSASSIRATWNNPSEDFYFIVVETDNDTIIPIFPSVILDALARFRFVSAPTTNSSISFLGGTLVSYGKHVVKVYHINKEYAALYENRTQDSRDLNQPPSNVQNALGVFSAFNSQNAYFDVVKE